MHTDSNNDHIESTDVLQAHVRRNASICPQFVKNQRIGKTQPSN